MFDHKLADYAVARFRRDGIAVKTRHNILSLRPGLPHEDRSSAAGFTLTTKQDGPVGVGMCVWSTGLMMNPFVQQALDDVHVYPRSSAIIHPSTASPQGEWILKRDAKTGGLLVDDHFRTQLVPRKGGGTEATMQNVFALGDVACVEGARLPATAQVANQQAKWLGRALNAGMGRGKMGEGFTFRNLGVMAYLGDMTAIMQTGGNTEIKG
jgi:NADH dehydrogenase FAD-containing subunit